MSASIKNIPRSNQQENNNYEISPNAQKPFKRLVIKEIINSVLHEILKGKNYTSVTNVTEWTKNIADEINTRIKDLAIQRYKHLVQVVIVQQTGAGFKYIARCRWDAECDTQISVHYNNETLACIVTVFGIYLY